MDDVLPRTHGGFLQTWRVWKPREYYLRSTVMSCVWPTLAPMRGKLDGHGDFNVQPGVYSFTRLDRAMDYALQILLSDAYDYPFGGRSYCYVGSLAIWGDVAEHQRGFRSSHAYPIAIAPFGCLNKVTHLQEVGLRYGIDTCRVELLQYITDRAMEGRIRWTSETQYEDSRHDPFRYQNLAPPNRCPVTATQARHLQALQDDHLRRYQSRLSALEPWPRKPWPRTTSTS